ATAMHASVRSGIDWFDLHASVQYGDTEVPLATLLEAAKDGALGVPLPDGSVGVLPTEWLMRWRRVAAGGKQVGAATRFTRAQASLLDALLAAAPDVDVDETFAIARDELRRFQDIGPMDAPPGFVGTLREYQREGLGWLEFLRRFRLGG